ncbi:fimbrial protein [Edaphovirga cremea]|uniref:fimbrial protein n=1 Tax=Edaphovirga cremea TaxID=2267246 RepID=UPI001FE32A5D|nr:type 1 fimbrial protein [Edaphovirga cremea]
MKRIKSVAQMMLLLVASCSSVWATVTCKLYSAATPRTDTVQLAPATISAGADMPNGTIIYQGKWLGGVGETQINCTTDLGRDDVLTYNYGTLLNSAPRPLSNWTGSPFGGAVYETNVPGIGVAISRGVTTGVVNQSVAEYSFINQGVTLPAKGFGYAVNAPTRYISLIKIGEITPGSYTLKAADLPSFKLFFDNPSNGIRVIGFPITTSIIQFQGQLTITTKTCVTPDVNVDMGSHEMRTTFTGEGSVTSWRDASIVLTNCPTFFGYYNNSNNITLFDYDTGGGRVIPNATNNNVGVRVTPSTSVIDSSNGIMSIDRSLPDAASGVGIQLGWGSNSGNPALFDFATEKPFQLPKDGRSEIKIPLAARYIQTDSMVTPGKAKGKAVFLINYY